MCWNKSHSVEQSFDYSQKLEIKKYLISKTSVESVKKDVYLIWEMKGGFPKFLGLHGEKQRMTIF